MAEVSKITGPSGTPDSGAKKDKTSVDADKFKEQMHKRVTEVGQVDPDEQKKRKRQEEAEEEGLTSTKEEEAPTPPSRVTPFSLESGQKKKSLMDLEGGGRGTSPTDFAKPAPGAPPAPKTPFSMAPTPDEMADDSGTLEEEAFEPPPAPPKKEAKEAVPAAPPTVTKEPAGAVVPPAAEEVPEELPASLPREEQKKPAMPAPLPPTPQQKPSEGTTAAALEGTQTKKVQDTSSLYQQVGASQPQKEQKEEAPVQVPEVQETTPQIPTPPVTGPTKASGASGVPGAPELPEKEKKEEIEEAETAEAEVQGTGPGIPPPPLTGVAPTPEKAKDKEKIGDQEEEKEKILPIPSGMPGLQPETGMAPAPEVTPSAPEPLPRYAMMNHQVQELFDRMVGVMTVMNLSGMTETVITLNMPQFASSVFFGTQIIIQEFSSAPQAYNIQLNGTPQAIELLQSNADDLMAAFQAGNYNFRVNRLETGYLSERERPLLRRKEKAEGGREEKKGDSPL